MYNTFVITEIGHVEINKCKQGKLLT